MNKCQREDPVFSCMLDEVWQGCPSPKTIQHLEKRVITTLVVDKFEELLPNNQSPLYLFPNRKACLELTQTCFPGCRQRHVSVK